MDENIEKKQNYLRTEILDKGYDPEEFVTFLIQKKGDMGSELEIWDYDELTLVVHEFTKHMESKKSPESNLMSSQDENGQSSNLQAKEEDQQSTTHPSENGESFEEKILKMNFEETIQCENIEHTELSKYEHLNITISMPEKHEGGFFSLSYMTYLVTTLPLGFKVRRRYSDFEWLRNNLHSHFVGSTIPPIPKKNFGERFNELFISKRMRNLERFLESLKLNPLIKSSQIFYDFLTIEKEEDFTTKRREYAVKAKQANTITEIETLDGCLHMKISKENELYCRSISKYITMNEILFQKLCTALKNLVLEINQLSERMMEISEIFSQLYDISEKYDDNTTVLNTYQTLSKMMKDWNDLNKRQSSLLDVELKEYFKYIKNEVICLRDLVDKVEETKNIFYKADKRLYYKKSDLFTRGDISRWELGEEEKNCDELFRNKDLAFSKMLSKESYYVNSLKQWYGYYLLQLINEYERLRLLNGRRHKAQVVKISHTRSDILADVRYVIRHDV